MLWRRFGREYLKQLEVKSIDRTFEYMDKELNLIERRSCRKYKREQIKDEELNEILKAGEYAPTVIVVLADKTKITYLEDGSLVMGNLMNAAHSLGIGSCWIHRAKEEFETEEGKALLKEWNISENYVGVGHCILGYPDGILQEPKPRKEDYITIVK